jgi:hypothetical protein
MTKTVNHRKQNHWCNSPTAKLGDVKLSPWKIEPSTLLREYHTQLPQLDLFDSRFDHICSILKCRRCVLGASTTSKLGRRT